MIELTSILVGLVLFAITPNTIAASETAEQCGSRSADTCLNTSTCDVFELSDGAETCELSCDLRAGVAACSESSACEWREGACEYASELPDC